MNDKTEEFEIGEKVTTDYETREFDNYYTRGPQEICGTCMYLKLDFDQFPCSHCHIIHHEKGC